MPITSRQHPVCKLVRALHDGKNRRRHGSFVVEGGNGVAAALGARWPIQRLLGAPEDLKKGWADLAREAGIETLEMDDDVLASICQAQTSPGVLAIVQMPQSLSFAAWRAPDGLALLLDGIGDPGNVGTLLRSADAIGAGAFALTENSADVFSPKVVRASAGSVFHVPIAPQTSPENWADLCKREKLPLILAVARDGENCFDFSWPHRCVLALGHETRGVSAELEKAATARVTIPMFGRAESLNVAAAGAVLLYAWRQNQEKYA